MPKKGRSEEQILRALHQAESGTTVREVCREHGISDATFYIWKKKYDAPRESIPTGGRDFGLVWSFGAGISGIYRTQQTQLTTSNRLPSSTASSALSLDSFSDPPFTFAEGGTKSWMSFGSAASLLCTAPA